MSIEMRICEDYLCPIAYKYNIVFQRFLKYIITNLSSSTMFCSTYVYPKKNIIQKQYKCVDKYV